MARLLIKESQRRTPHDIQQRPGRKRSEVDNVMFQHKSKGLLTKDQEVELIKRVQAGDQLAKEEMLRANLRLVSAMARRWASPLLPFEDAYQEASMGVIKAAETFDLERNVKFSTYAVCWMRHHLARAGENQGRLVRVPSHAIESHRAMLAAEHKLRNAFGCDPTDQSIEAELGWTDGSAGQLRERVRQPLSFDALWGERSEGDNLLQLLEDTGAQEELDGVAGKVAQQEALARILETLKRKEEDILRRRVGLDPYDVPQSLQEIADHYCCSREGVRQVEARAIKKCRTAAEALGIQLSDLI